MKSVPLAMYVYTLCTGVCKLHFSGAANVVPVELLALHDCTFARSLSIFCVCRHAEIRQDYIGSTRSGGVTGLALEL